LIAQWTFGTSVRRLRGDRSQPDLDSTVTVTELLIRPFRRSPAVVAMAEEFLRHFAEVRLVDVTYDVAREAARLRARTGLPTPDALVVASAATTEADILVTNDRSWPGRLAGELVDLDLVVLSDVLAPAG
jgi:predicted nucleic acid-binding protein